MTGIVNSTGARSGIIGTTVGTPVTDLSTATFPAGHVIQTTDADDASEETHTTPSLSSWEDTVVLGTITTTSATNSVIAHFYYCMYVWNASGTHGLSFRTEKTYTGIAAEDKYPDTMNFASGANYQASHYFGAAAAGIDTTHSYAYSIQDDVCGFAGAITYTLQSYGYNIAGGYEIGGASNGRWSVWFQEIQR